MNTLLVTEAAKMRSRSKESARQHEAKMAKVAAKTEAAHARNETEVRAEVRRRYREDWLGTIGEAADTSSHTSTTIYAIGSEENREELAWIKDEARSILEDEGFEVSFQSEHRSHADDDPGREETDMTISWGE
jgi:hypothetical protein